MGILRVFLILGLGISLYGGPSAEVDFRGPALVAQEDEKKDDDSSGRWEGVAMAGLEVPFANNS